MTIEYTAALSAIRLGSVAGLRAAFEPLTLAEMAELGTFIGPHRLRAAVVSQPTATAFRPRGEPLDTTVALVEINRQAFNVASGMQRPLAPDPQLAAGVRAALLDVAQRRRAKPLLTMPDDATGTLPNPASVPPPLGDADYAGAAARQNVEVASIKAVASVESSGRGFDGQGRPKILFEAHHFSTHTANRYNRTHPHLSVPARLWRQGRRFYRWDQYERLREAMVLDIDAALKATSWGKFQVLGSNHNGWNDVRTFVAAMFVSEGNHLRAFEAYCNDNHLMGFIRSHDWLSFARGYNGQSQEGYDTRIADAYRAVGGTARSGRR